MDNKEAIARIRDHMEIHFANEYPRAIKITEALEMAIKAIEKQIPKKPNFKSYDIWNGEYYCPACNNFLGFYHNKHNACCSNCGQKIDWNRSVLEKQIPKKVVEINIPNTYYSKAGVRYECPACHKINYYKETDHCILCGQALDWSEV